MNEDQYIYSEKDFEQAIEETIKDTLGWQPDMIDFLTKKLTKNLREYTNLYRFYRRNCAGCVGSPKECNLAYGRGKAKGAWDKARKGKIFNCPARTGGTLIFNSRKPEEGPKSVDISDRKEKPYPIIRLEEEEVKKE